MNRKPVSVSLLCLFLLAMGYTACPHHGALPMLVGEAHPHEHQGCDQEHPGEHDSEPCQCVCCELFIKPSVTPVSFAAPGFLFAGALPAKVCSYDSLSSCGTVAITLESFLESPPSFPPGTLMPGLNALLT